MIDPQKIKMMILKKEKRSKKERIKGGGEKRTSLKMSFLSLIIIKTNRTSLTVYTPDIFNCS